MGHIAKNIDLNRPPHRRRAQNVERVLSSKTTVTLVPPFPIFIFGVFLFLGCTIYFISLVNHCISPLVIGDLNLLFL
jgi:hypothetical protein